jgi:hypothetical protein
MIRLLAFVVLAVFGWLVFGGASHEARYSLPDSHYRLVVSLAPMHPYLAEYERALSVDGNGEAIRLLVPPHGSLVAVMLVALAPASREMQGVRRKRSLLWYPSRRI